MTIQPCLASGTQTLAGPSLSVYVLPSRTVSVGIYDVIDLTSSNTYDVVNGVKTLGNAPTPQTIINTLDDVFKQAGVSFQLSGTGNVNVHYDTSSKDGKLEEVEGNTIADALGNNTDNIQIYLTKASGVVYESDTNQYVRGFSGGDTQKFSFVCVNTITSGSGSVDLVAAHEVGHDLDLAFRNRTNGGHDPGPFPPESQATGLGLMISGAPNSITHVAPANPGRWLPHEDWRHANESANPTSHE